MAPAPPVPVITSAPPSLWSRFSKFVADNKTLIYTVGAATFVVVSGAGIYYVYYKKSSSPTAPSSPPAEAAPETKTASEKKKAKKEKRKQKKEKERQEGAKESVADEQSPSTETKPLAQPTLEEEQSDLPDVSDEALASVSPETRKEYSIQYKNAGNSEFKKKSYDKAIELYTKAITLSPDAVFYSNRAACYSAQEKWAKVIEDATAALELEPEYLKALSRRGNAYEKLEQYPDAIVDYTAVCILSGSPNDPLSASIDRLLQKCGEIRAQELLRTKKRALPSIAFVTSYLDSFHERPIPPEVSSASEVSGNYYLKLGMEAMEKKTVESYEEACNDFNKAVELGAENMALALELRGTFKFLMADNQGAMEDLNKSIELAPCVQAYVKRALLFMDLSDPVKCNADFESAIGLDPTSPDIYYHRGQIHFLLSEFADAAKDYQKSIDLDKKFVYSHIQLAVTQYKLGSTSSAMAGFRRCIKNFDKTPDVFNYYGELLMDQQRYSDAIEKFDQAFEIEKTQKTSGINVLPLINKAFVLWHYKQGTVQEAEELCKKALLLDPQSDIAVGTLAQLVLSQNRMDDALVYFEKQLELARTETEITQAATYIEAAKTQAKLIENYPQLKARLAGMSQGMGM
ncbi:mitochondrial precursor protein [Lipomyces tetrasporus]|uniref:Mitochondrial protein n=1 Tax=Lipomyces tetrasporus TaxID=54092 RepID=A0AAD7VTM6_9ASCO|nr:mitochondrial precursor protein [Lipomyces tetrasporus]KAJ8100315.1 mitochondrial precursor protein [Lipomyces tetrasporus]